MIIAFKRHVQRNLKVQHSVIASFLIELRRLLQMIKTEEVTDLMEESYVQSGCSLLEGTKERKRNDN